MLIVCFIAAFGAGLTVGMLMERGQGTVVTQPGSPPVVPETRPAVPAPEKLGTAAPAKAPGGPTRESPPDRPVSPGATVQASNPLRLDGVRMFVSFGLGYLKLSREQSDEMNKIWSTAIRQM